MSRRKPYSPGRHRAQNHLTAHADETIGAISAPGMDHPLIPRGNAALITENGPLLALIERLRISGRFAYDSEFIGEMTYIPKLCLIQVASATEVALIDPLADIDLTPFWELLCDPNVEKIVHAGAQDIEPVVRHLGRAPINVFDTQISAGFMGLTYPVALSKLVSELIGAKLGKGLTFTHWDQRPLSGQQLRYAADDVRYLPAVREIIGKKLLALNHTEWANQECARQCDPELYHFDPDTQYLRVRGAGSLQPRGLAILRELTNWRDQQARASDVPARTFVKDEVLIDLSRSPVKTVEKLANVRGLPRPVEKQHGTEIITVIARALASDLDKIPNPRDIELTPSQKFAGDALWAAVQALASGQSIDPALVASRQEITDLWRHLTGEYPDDQLRLLNGWRKIAVGDRLIELFNGKARLELSWLDQRLVVRPL